MTTTEQISALAELDGWKINNDLSRPGIGIWYEHVVRKPVRWADLPSYLTSYDAIIPLIQRQDSKTMSSFGYDATPDQLAEAFLRTIGKWKD